MTAPDTVGKLGDVIRQDLSVLQSEATTVTEPSPNENRELATLGLRLANATTGLRVKAVSLHDADGRVLWSSAPILSIEQREAVRDGLEHFSGVGARMRVDRSLAGNQIAVLLRAADRAGHTLGFAMLLLDSRVLLSKGRGADLPVPALQLVHEFGRLLARQGVQGAVIDAAARPAPAATGSFGEGLVPAAETRLADFDVDRELALLRELQLSLHVQALSPLRPTSRVRRFEVLLRSRSQGMDSNTAPVELLKRASDNGLGTVIDRRVVTQLLGWLRTRPDIVEHGPCMFSVNLSPTALQDEHFLRFVQQQLEASHMPPGLLAFEIPAEVLAARKLQAQRVAQALQAIGCGLVIDDYAMSDGQLSLLKLPSVRLVKLDPKLTDPAQADVFSEALVAACAQIARICGFFTVAKQIGTDELRDHCRSLGIDFVQSFTYGGTQPIDAIVPLERIEDPEKPAPVAP